MAKRKEVDVDEDLIKSMMSGDIPRLNQEPIKEETIPKKEVPVSDSITKNSVMEDEIAEIQEKETGQPKSKRRREPKDYKSVFLRKDTGTKKQTYINAALYDKISKILSIIAKDISVPNFIDNVLDNHLKEYKEEINDIYRNNSDLLL
ncbi:DUF3408 domain-containing protein [Bacteroides sp. 51]|uniref:DUF3408 domain-containing protein n=1 Tax=Bacteroides sp. 51 TaxID=2302938 RepID=UPI0013D6ECF7|nr:DUF3408 domain-containing protein [Bacteroides sp. 51]NDV81546.1 DUF3408 domain-containing protein [Bacteroides sp. 51]